MAEISIKGARRTEFGKGALYVFVWSLAFFSLLKKSDGESVVPPGSVDLHKSV